MIVAVLAILLVLMFCACTILWVLLAETLDELRKAERQVSLTKTLTDIHREQMTEGPEHVFWPRSLRLNHGPKEETFYIECKRDAEGAEAYWWLTWPRTAGPGGET